MVLKALSTGGPPPWPAGPQLSAWGIASFRNHPPRWPPGVSSLPRHPLLVFQLPSGAAQPGLAVLGDQLFQDARRCQVLSLNPHSSFPSFHTWVGAMLGGTPDAPALGPPGAREPAGPRLSSVEVLGLVDPGSTPSLSPAPSLFPQHSFPNTTQRLRASNCLGSRQCPVGGTCPHLPPHSSKGSPLPFRGHPWGECPLLAPPWGMENGMGSPRAPHNFLYICINKWDFNGAPHPHVVITV